MEDLSYSAKPLQSAKTIEHQPGLDRKAVCEFTLRQRYHSNKQTNIARRYCESILQVNHNFKTITLSQDCNVVE